MANNPWKDLPAGKNPPEEIDVVIEIVKGSNNKTELDHDSGMIKLDRVLHAPFKYEWDYGLIPQTLADDGDPADGIVLIDNPTSPGVVIPCRPVGIMHMVDDGDQDDKIICVAADDPTRKDIKDIDDIDASEKEKMRTWFENYKKKEGKTVEVTGFEGAEVAKRYINQAIELYKEKIGE